MLRERKIKLSNLRKAVEAGKLDAAEWGDSAWQAEYLEIILHLRLWSRILAKMRDEGHEGAAHYYSRGPERLLANGKRGYILDGWNGAPTPRWPTSHNPNTCWDGIRRNCYGSIAELLRQVSWDPNCQAVQDELFIRWRISIVADDNAEAPEAVLQETI